MPTGKYKLERGVGRAGARASPWAGKGKMFCGYRNKGNIAGDVIARSEEEVQGEGVSACLWKMLAVTHIR